MRRIVIASAQQLEDLVKDNAPRNAAAWVLVKRDAMGRLIQRVPQDKTFALHPFEFAWLAGDWSFDFFGQGGQIISTTTDTSISIEEKSPAQVAGADKTLATISAKDIPSVLLRDPEFLQTFHTYQAKKWTAEVSEVNQRAVRDMKRTSEVTDAFELAKSYRHELMEAHDQLYLMQRRSNELVHTNMAFLDIHQAQLAKTATQAASGRETSQIVGAVHDVMSQISQLIAMFISAHYGTKGGQQTPEGLKLPNGDILPQKLVDYVAAHLGIPKKTGNPGDAPADGAAPTAITPAAPSATPAAPIATTPAVITPQAPNAATVSAPQPTVKVEPSNQAGRAKPRRPRNKQFKSAAPSVVAAAPTAITPAAPANAPITIAPAAPASAPITITPVVTPIAIAPAAPIAITPAASPAAPIAITPAAPANAPIGITPAALGSAPIATAPAAPPTAPIAITPAAPASAPIAIVSAGPASAPIAIAPVAPPAAPIAIAPASASPDKPEVLMTEAVEQSADAFTYCHCGSGKLWRFCHGPDEKMANTTAMLIAKMLSSQDQEE